MRYGVGIDVSKGKSTISVMNENGETVIKPFDVKHDVEGMKELEEKIKGFPKTEMKFVMEATGNYHLPISVYLRENKYFVTIENALVIKRYINQDIRKKKTDKKDAIKISKYAIEKWNELKEPKESEEVYEALRMLSRQYFSQVTMKAKAKINLSNVCDMIFPGFYQLLTDNSLEVGMAILKKYNTAEEIKKVDENTFVEEVSKIAEKQKHDIAGANLARKVYLHAQNVISPTKATKYTKLIVEECTKVLTATIKATNNIISKMSEIASELPEYKEIKEMSGVGEKTGVTLIAEIGDIKKFRNAGSLIAYAGIDSPPNQSGQNEGRGMKISKKGNKYLRRVLYQISKGTLKINSDKNIIGEYVRKKIGEGKAKNVAIIAGSNKILRMYFGIAKRLYLIN